MSDFFLGASNFLQSVREHPNAPRFNFNSSDLLNRDTLCEVKAFAQRGSRQPFWSPGNLPGWMQGFVDRVYREVPYYRALGGVPSEFGAIPTIDRGVLKEQMPRLVPDSAELSALTVYTTSGTTGSTLAIPTDAPVTTKVLVLIEQLLHRVGAGDLPRGSGEIALAAVFCQEQTLTYPSLSQYLEGALTLKVNLHPSQWRQGADARRFLLDLKPAVITGSPFSLQKLATDCSELRPRAVLSSAEKLLDGFRTRLEEVFQCPVIDVYGLTEAKFIAARTIGEGHDLLCGDLFVEILDQKGRGMGPGEKGEITLTGGRNRFLPLLRYRTGDFAALEYRGGQPYLTGLEGRECAFLVNGDGGSICGLDIVNCFQQLPLVGFSFQQKPDRSYQLFYCGDVGEVVLSALLRDRFALTGEVFKSTTWTGKSHLFRTLPNGEQLPCKSSTSNLNQDC